MLKTIICQSCISMLIFAGSLSLKGADIVWTNLNGGAWNAAANWNPNQLPAAADTVWITNAGTYTVTSSVSPTLAALNLGSGASGGLQTLLLTAGTLTVTNTAGAANSIINLNGGTLLAAGPFNSAGAVNENSASSSWRLLVTNATVNSFNLTNGELRGGTLTVTNCTWVNGNWYADAVGDKTIIPTNGVLNFVGTATRTLSYYAGGSGRYIDNYGIWKWTSNSVLQAYPCVVNNYGTVNIMGTGAAATYSQFVYATGTRPIWNNFGTVTKTPGTNIFYFSCDVNNYGTLDIQSGQLSLTSSTTTNAATGLISLGTGAQLIADLGDTVTLAAGSSLTGLTTNAVQIINATVNVFTTNISIPSLLLNDVNASLRQNTNNVIPTINQNAGTWRINVPTTVGTYNFNAGELRGVTLTVTNLNWVAGDMNADTTNNDRTIIPAGGVMNFLGTTTRNFSYYTAAGPGRGLDNYGTINWSGNALLYSYGVVNNYGSVIVSAAGTPEFVWNGLHTPATWNNYGTFTRNGSTPFYFNGGLLNNSGTIDIQTGQVSFYNVTATNLDIGLISIGSGAQLIVEQNSVVSLNPGSSITGVSDNPVRLESATVYMRTVNLSIPSLLLNNANSSLQQNTNNVIPAINQNAGTWRLNVPTTVATYNLTNGEMRGANLIVTNFNWFGGNLNADGVNSNTVTVVSNLNISGASPKTMSYYTAPGRALINNGTGTWSGANISGQGGATIQNNGSLTQNADTALQWGGTGAQLVFQNTGTFTKANGTNASYFYATSVTNSGTFNIQAGSIRFGNAFVQTAGSANLKSNFQADSILRIESGSLSGSGSVAGIFYNNGTLNPGTSPGLITGTQFTNSVSATVNIELGGTSGGTNYDQIRLTGMATLNGNLNVQFVNGFTPVLSNAFTVLTFASRSGTFSSVTAPPNFEFTPIYTTTNLTLLVSGLTNAPLQIITAPSNQIVWQPDPAAFSVIASGNTPLAYQWQLNGTNIVDATNFAYSIPATVPTNSGIYRVVVTDSTAVQTNVSVLLTVIPFDGRIYWTNTAGGVWNVANNWNPHRIPGVTNTAVITNAGSYIVDLPAGTTTVGSVILGLDSATNMPRLDVDNGTFTLNNSLRVGSNSVWFLYPGTIFNGAGDVDVFGTFNFYGGTLSGTGRTIIETNATLTLYNSLQHKYVSGRNIENYGTLNYTVDSFGDGNSLEFSAGGSFTNQASGTMSLRANGLIYQGANTPRSYFVNYGTLNTGNVPSSAPTLLYLDLVNYGTIASGGSIYLARGTNYGTLQFNGTLTGMSFLGDETGGEYFSFEPGTILIGARPNIYAAGLVRWNSPNTVHNGLLTVGSAAGGYSSAGTQFLVTSAYTNSFQVSVGRGEFKIAANAVADLQLLSDTLVNGFWSYAINNLGTISADNVSHTSRNFDNSGLLVVRTNISWSGGSFYGTVPGHVVITTTSAANFAGGSIDSQFIENFGTGSVTASTPLTGNSYLENKTNAQLTFVGGSLSTGPASAANYGAISGYGSIGFTATNFNSILADDSLARTLTISTLIQQSGLTEIRRGQLGGNLQILGGTLAGTNIINGSVFNAATISPGRPFGRLTITGNYTNTSTGLQLMPIGGINSYPQIRISGSANLAGTLKVTFTNGFYPVTGNTFTSLTFTASAGAFDAVTTPGYDFEKIYSPTNFLLRASNSLPIMSLSVLPGGTQLVCTPFRILASGADLDGAVTNVDVFMDGSPSFSAPGSTANTTVESDSPLTISIVARGRDDRNGYGYATQQVSILNYPFTNMLFLGGVRTNDFKVCLVGEAGRDYEIFGSTNLASTNWVDLGTMTVNNGTWHYVDQRTLTNRPYRFYRAQQLP